MHMSTVNLLTLLLVAFSVMCAPQYEMLTTPFPQRICSKCDDDIYGCRAEQITSEVCQQGITSCMVEMFFSPNSSKMFNFRAGCSTRRSCPEGYTRLMCTNFINGIKTCRLCCFDNNCHDPTPGSAMRISVMKELMLNSGFSMESLDDHLAREYQIALDRGRTSSTRTTTTTTTATPTVAATTTTTEDFFSAIKHITESSELGRDPTSIHAEIPENRDEQSLTVTVKNEPASDLHVKDSALPSAEMTFKEKVPGSGIMTSTTEEGKSEEERDRLAKEIIAASGNSYAEQEGETLAEIQSIQMSDQGYGEEAAPVEKEATAVYYKGSPNTAMRGVLGILPPLLIVLVAVEAM